MEQDKVHGGNDEVTKANVHVSIPNQSEQSLNKGENQGCKKRVTIAIFIRVPSLEAKYKLKSQMQGNGISIKNSESFLLHFPSFWEPKIVSRW